jgi:polysaccharide export outer membrane protein
MFLFLRKNSSTIIKDLRLKSILLFFIGAILLQSCGTGTPLITKRENVEYFNDVKIGSQDKIVYYQNKIQINDILSIKVGELILEAVEPYNGSLLGSGLESAQLNGYLVSYEGNIVFPRLGTIAVAGKTTTEVEQIVNKLLIEKSLVKDPTCSVRIINARVTVIGPVGSGGSVGGTIPFGGNNTLTILQAVGNIAPAGIKNDIVLIREEDGVRRYVKLDITKIDLINGPYYYLKQNDVIYVKPNGPAVLQSGWLPSIGAIIGSLSLIVSLYLLATR